MFSRALHQPVGGHPETVSSHDQFFVGIHWWAFCYGGWSSMTETTLMFRALMAKMMWSWTEDGLLAETLLPESLFSGEKAWALPDVMPLETNNGIDWGLYNQLILSGQGSIFYCGYSLYHIFSYIIICVTLWYHTSGKINSTKGQLYSNRWPICTWSRLINCSIETLFDNILSWTFGITLLNKQ